MTKENEKVYTIVAGVNGAVKTTYIQQNRERFEKVVDEDALAAEYGSQMLGGREAVRLIETYLHSGESFTQETTLSGMKTCRTIQKAHRLGYHVRLLYINTDSVEECIKRIAYRVAHGGHHIPDELVRKRFQKKESDLNRILRFCDEIHFYENRDRVFYEVRNSLYLTAGEIRNEKKMTI